MVGSEANIGAENELPMFADREEQIRQAQWFAALSVNSIIIMGSTTIRLMQAQGFQGVDDQRILVPWTRGHGLTPDELLSDLQKKDRHIIVAGGATTFRLFMPFCDNYYLRRVTLVNPPDFRLDPVLPSWQSRHVDAGTHKMPRPS